MPNLSVVIPILIREPSWQLPMTVCALSTLLATAASSFELIVVESQEPGQDCYVDVMKLKQWTGAVRTLVIPYRNNPTADINAGLDLATGDYVMYTGNDVFVRPGWDAAILDCFKIPRCGIATLASADLKDTPVAQYFGQTKINFGLYGPLMAFASHRRFDAETFPSQFADSDMMMQVTDEGLECYRNNAVVIQHLNRQTINGPEHEEGTKTAQAKFLEKWGHSPSMTYRLLSEGWIV